MFPKTITFELQNFFVIYISYQTYLNLYQTYKPIFKVQMFTNILPNWTFYHLPEGCAISSLEIYHNFALLLSVLCLENLFYFVSAIFHYRQLVQRIYCSFYLHKNILLFVVLSNKRLSHKPVLGSLKRLKYLVPDIIVC